ncbi:uncharacterized protein LOC124775916 isoform X2 [Schistocerca piceifrons]|uniref:uncharacterized protein LOC124775916 isoform X2 n=1 Tax=Schistocerca piceifrons TaxID=274613 RepID=UPI001F5F3480|nr:uncharacterized protein LOC124775916 isoform X2 [Schistocerca piceifrons]
MPVVWVYMNGHITARVDGGCDEPDECPLAEDPSRYLQPLPKPPLARARGHAHRKVQRLAQYEQYLADYLAETRADHADHEQLVRASAKAKQALKRGQEESDLERIQDLFPNDCLRLYDKDALTMMKGLIRKRSTTAARLQRALSAKAARPSTGSEPSSPQQQPQPQPRDKRQFLMEAPVTFTTGVQSQERHLFLFNDLLLVAKARSGGNFKLKDKVRVSEMWLTKHSIEDVIEVHKSPETSFVLGWPTTNVVATFNTQAARDLWWNKLNEVVSTERDKEPRSTNIQVVYYDAATSIEYCKTFSVSPEETARACIRLALQHLEMRGLDPDDFQLWAKTSREEAPYPLIGHERPFAIKLSCLRDGLSAEEGFDLDHCNNVHGPDPLAKCQFILRSKRKPVSEATSGSENKKNSKKSRKSPMRIRQVFRRSMSKGEDCTDCPLGALFGLPLARLSNGETLPRPVMAMLQQVFLKGPFTQGIFRKSANARLVRELRDKLDAGEDIRLEHMPVLVVAAVLKDFLRSLPDPLLCSTLYPLWMEAVECQDEQEKLLRIKSVLDQLPKPNLLLLSMFVCVLHHISRRSAHNLMTAANLGVCVGPSLLWAASPATLTPSSSRAVPALAELLVARAELLFGPHLPLMLGEPPTERQDSGAEESDSLHSGGLRRDDSSIDSLERELLEPCPPPRKDKMSLSRDSGLTMSDSQLYTPDEEESGSSSSGSGRALYPPAQPACYDIHSHNKVTSSYSVPAAGTAQNVGHNNESQVQNVQSTTREYVRVYSGWEERVQECCRNQSSEDSIYARPGQKQGPNQPPGVINPNFQRQDWFRQRSHLKRLNSGGTGSPASSKSSHQSGSSSGSTSSGVGGLHQHNYRSTNVTNLIRRSASEESLLNDIGDHSAYDTENGPVLYKRPALHRKGRAPPPPPPVNSSPCSDPVYSHRSPPTPIVRSKSAHHLCSEPESPVLSYNQVESSPVENCELKGDIQMMSSKSQRTGHRRAARASVEDWSLSRSTPHIPVLDEVDRSYDSSTLSDDDSTPHVSRSNSRGKDCASANSAWDNAYGSTPSELLVHAAPVNIREESSSDSDQPSELHKLSSTPSVLRRVSAPATTSASTPLHESSAPPLPPKRSSVDVKLRHLPPVHVETVSPANSGKLSSQISYASKDENMQWESSEQVPRKSSECRGRIRQKEVSNRASQRSKSLPPPPGEKTQKEEDCNTTQNQADQGKNLKSEISWSVSHLRTLFTNGVQPPPYRPPPSVIPSYRAPITTYHLGDNSQSERYVVSRSLNLDSTQRLRMDSTDEEESYV